MLFYNREGKNMAKLALINKQDIPKANSPNHPKSASIIPFPSVDVKTDDNDNYSEIEVIEIPVVKKMVFQFNKPNKLDFS